MDPMEDDRLPSADPQSGPEPSSLESSFLLPLNLNREQDLVGAGLANMGNTCFMNAVLQCLTHTVPLVQKICDAEHSCPNNGDAEDNFCSFCTLKEHINQCLIASGHVISPHKLVANLSKISSCFEPGQQEDAHEFLTSLLDSVHNSSLSRGPKDKPALLDEDSIVTEIFGGRLRSQLRCCDCGHCSDTYEPFLNLSLEIDNVDNIMDALKSFTKVEKIEDPEVKITCGGCNSQVSMEKQLKLDRAPQVASLHLKRFKNNGIFSSKIFDPVKYPLELDLKPFLSCPQDDVDLKYDLYAVVIHFGSAYGGHYNCIVRSSLTSWHEMDDSQVSKFPESDVLDMDQTAYILFYIKQGSTCWFSSLMKENIPNLDTPISVLDHAEQNHSSGESTCSSFTGTPERPEHGCQSKMDCSTGPTTNDSRNEYESSHLESPPRPFNHANSDDRGTSRSADYFIPRYGTPQRMLSQKLSDMFEDETFEDEEDDNLVSRVLQLQPGKGKEEKKPDLRTASAPDSKMASGRKAYGRVIRNMPKSRRDGIMNLIESQQNSNSKADDNKRQHLGAKGSYPYRKRVQQSRSPFLMG